MNFLYALLIMGAILLLMSLLTTDKQKKWRNNHEDLGR